MKFKTSFHKNINIIALYMMCCMIVLSAGANIYELHMQGESFNWVDFHSILKIEQIKEATAIIESIIVKLTQAALEVVRYLLKG